MAKDKRGVTLLELIITLAITTMIVGVVMSYFGLTDRMFSRMDARSAEQQQVRLASQRIVQELRNITSYNLEDSPTASGKWLYESGNRLISRDGATETVWVDSLIAEDGITFQLVLASGTNGSASARYAMEVSVTGVDGYAITTQILLNNIRFDDGDTAGDVGAAARLALAYTK